MTELEKIAYAKSFIDRLANGVNPIDNSKIPDEDIVNNVRISRCLFYVSDVLRQVIDSEGVKVEAIEKPKKIKKKAFYLLPEQIANFQYSETPIPLSEIARRINLIGPQEGVRKFPRSKMPKWLISIGLVEEYINNYGHISKRPTSQGKEFGISIEEREGYRGNYCVMLFNLDAQRFIIDNIEAIMNF